MTRGVLLGILLVVINLVFVVLHMVTENKEGAVASTIGLFAGLVLVLISWRDDGSRK